MSQVFAETGRFPLLALRGARLRDSRPAPMVRHGRDMRRSALLVLEIACAATHSVSCVPPAETAQAPRPASTGASAPAAPRPEDTWLGENRKGSRADRTGLCAGSAGPRRERALLAAGHVDSWTFRAVSSARLWGPRTSLRRVNDAFARAFGAHRVGRKPPYFRLSGRKSAHPLRTPRCHEFRAGRAVRRARGARSAHPRVQFLSAFVRTAMQRDALHARRSLEREDRERLDELHALRRSRSRRYGARLPVVPPARSEPARTSSS